MSGTALPARGGDDCNHLSALVTNLRSFKEHTLVDLLDHVGGVEVMRPGNGVNWTLGVGRWGRREKESRGFSWEFGIGKFRGSGESVVDGGSREHALQSLGGWVLGGPQQSNA